ncbi:phosphoribosylformylglycinamidine synthase subunit PurS [Alkalicoccus chagannorensis]|uniref:phosphoribosylformylglycinamidine synthase subunit PurS n=1 Tax=Alkalicoccus chagannorensis TaxID=427072 RepID=UPI000416D062|nr:phosphoribosylformylglycinamidine synthase subunit PurS [Alkalicoccus chagannorensis]
MAKTYDATVYVTWKSGVLDPQGSAVQDSLQQLGYDNVSGTTISKMIQLRIEAEPGQAEQQMEEMCEKLLANPVIEDYTFELEEVVAQ